MGDNLRENDYLNNTVWCKLAPSKYGVGVYAIRDIPKNTLLTDNDRQRLIIPEIYAFTEEEFMLLVKPIRDLILDKTYYESDCKVFKFMSPNSECYLQDFTNHSYTPNVDKHFITLRDIKEGEEIFENFTEFAVDMHKLNKQHYTFL